VNEERALRPDELVRQFDRLSGRLTTLETRAVLTPTTPAVQTLLLVDIGVPALGLMTQGGGIMVVASAAFTTPRVGTLQLEGQLDARMEAWDNTIGAPRRDVWTDIFNLAPGALVNGHQEMPFGLDRVTKTSSSAAGIAANVGTYTARWMVDMEATNMIRIYGGWLRVTWVG
jgi:hypothetical protein